jgi:mycofactocin precursor
MTTEAAAPELTARAEQTEARKDQDTPGAAAAPQEELVVEELIVEDVSIDGMCGVY